MIPRKEAQRLLAEFISAIDAAETVDDEELDYEGMRKVAHDLVASSDLVLRGSENIEQKGRRYLAEGRITIKSVDNRAGGLIVAEARGTDGVYLLGYDPTNRQWRCTCRSGRRGRCSHIIALKLTTDTTTRGAST